MRVTILDGDTQADGPELSLKLQALADELERRGHCVRTFRLGQMQIHDCIGCFDCWLKNPGLCAIRDEVEILCRQVVVSDLLILASSIRMGYLTATLKRALERLLPLMLPYLKLRDGESHHQQRYGACPFFGLYLRPSEDTDGEDLRILSTLVHRMALNFQTRLVLQATSRDAPEEVADAIGRL